MLWKFILAEQCKNWFCNIEKPSIGTAFLLSFSSWNPVNKTSERSNIYRIQRYKKTTSARSHNKRYFAKNTSDDSHTIVSLSVHTEILPLSATFESRESTSLRSSNLSI